MPRDYSRSGCETCKRRRKKCDEGKPSCGTCSRLELRCRYGPDSTNPPWRQQSTQTFRLDLGSPQVQTALLPIAQFRPRELSVITRVPTSMSHFLLPTLSKTGGEVKGLMQIVFTDLAVRDAVVSCFSAITPTPNDQNSDLNRNSLGSALRSVRARLGVLDDSFRDLSALQIAIQFLGLLESLGPQESPDPITHWIALSMLTCHLAQKYPSGSSPLPRSLHILALEAVIYHFATLLPFAKDVRMLNRVWKQNDIYSLLLQVNPEGGNRLASSPLLGGQYELWRLSFDVVSWSRLGPEVCRPSDLQISQCKELVRQIQSGLHEFFAAGQAANLAQRRSMVDVSNLHCIALLIVLTGLEKATPERTEQINKLVKIGVQDFLKWQLVFRPYPTATWAIHIFICAISEQDDWDNFERKLSCLKAYMDKGHLRRLESVLAQRALVQLRYSKEDESAATSRHESDLPGLLFLLHQPEGLLQDWRS